MVSGILFQSRKQHVLYIAELFHETFFNANLTRKIHQLLFPLEKREKWKHITISCIPGT